MQNASSRMNLKHKQSNDATRNYDNMSIVDCGVLGRDEFEREEKDEKLDETHLKSGYNSSQNHMFSFQAPNKSSRSSFPPMPNNRLGQNRASRHLVESKRSSIDFNRS